MEGLQYPLAASRTDLIRLYKYNTSDHEFFGMVPGYKQNYLASNVDFLDPKDGKRKPFAQRYRKFSTKIHGVRVLAFGFLFDFTGNDKNTVVQPVEDTIREQWFQDAIRDRDVDLFVVAGHVGLTQGEFENLYRAIRDVQWDVPIMFFGGHLHIRDYKKFDDKAYGLASGRYMETIGFQSISGLPSHKEQDESMSVQLVQPNFARRYIDNNLYSFQHHTHLNETTFPTDRGRNISSMIAKARKELDLDKRYGCAPQDYWMTRAPYPSEDSIFTWLDSHVVPDKVVEPRRADKPRIIIGNTGAMRFDIFKGPFNRDTEFIVSPFTSGFRYIKHVPYSTADRLLEVLNNAGQFFSSSSSELGTKELAPPEEASTRYTKVLPPSSSKNHLHLQNPEYPGSLSLLSREPGLTPGYTTIDDAGTDGDDTIHSQLAFYKVPPCFESRVNVKDYVKPEETVDVVYLDFIQPWVLAAMRFLGAEYKDGDTAPYAEGKSFTRMIREWVEENWKGDC